MLTSDTPNEFQATWTEIARANKALVVQKQDASSW